MVTAALAGSGGDHYLRGALRHCCRRDRGSRSDGLGVVDKADGGSPLASGRHHLLKKCHTYLFFPAALLAALGLGAHVSQAKMSVRA